MSKMKRAAAIVLAAAMTMGSTLTVFAADTGSGETHGKGENEGHVDMELINVVLPTVPTGDGSPFEYVADPERLIQATAGARYEDYKFPAKDDDKGVYFRVGEKEFSNTSQTLQIINKSSCDVTITVTASVTASAGDKDLELATTSTPSADKPLYLNLKVGTTDTTIAASGTPVAKTIEGTPNNFEVQYTDKGYEYVPKADAAYWKALNFSVNGEVYKGAVAAGTTVPTIDVTWAFAKAADDATADSTEQVQYEEIEKPGIVSVSDFVKSEPKDVVIKFSLGKGSKAVAADGVVLNAGGKDVNAAKYKLNMNARTVTIDKNAGVLTGANEDLPFTLTLTNSGSKVKELSGTIAIKEEPDATEPEIISVTDFNKSNPEDVVITFSLGSGDKAVEADGVKLNVGGKDVNSDKYVVDMDAKTVTINKTAGVLTGASVETSFTITLTNSGSNVKELTGTIVINE